MSEHVFTDDEIRQIIDVINRTKHTQYIGARYVPIFGRKGETSITWNNSAPYEPLTIVLYNGASYTSRQYVPAGIDVHDERFWANTGNYNAQIEQYRRETQANTEKLAALGIDSVTEATDMLDRINRMDINTTLNTDIFKNLGIENVPQSTTYNEHIQHIYNTLNELINDSQVKNNTIVKVLQNTSNYIGVTNYKISNTSGTNSVQLKNGMYAIPYYTYVSPENFGAYGDGIHNDTTPMNMAIAYAIANHMNVEFNSNATYSCDFTVTLVATDSIIINGNNATVKPISSGCTVNYNGKWDTDSFGYNSNINNVKFELNANNTSAINFNCDSFFYSPFPFEIKNCTFNYNGNNKVNAIIVDNCNGVRICNNNFTGNNNLIAILIQNGINYLINNNIFYRCDKCIYAHSIDDRACEGIIASNNIMLHCNIGVIIDNTETRINVGNQITNNMIDQTAIAGIQLSRGSTNKILNNYIGATSDPNTGENFNAIHLTTDSSEIMITIANNTFSGNSNNNIGINIDAAKLNRSNISDNNFIGFNTDINTTVNSDNNQFSVIKNNYFARTAAGNKLCNRNDTNYTWIQNTNNGSEYATSSTILNNINFVKIQSYGETINLTTGTQIELKNNTANDWVLIIETKSNNNPIQIFGGSQATDRIPITFPHTGKSNIVYTIKSGDVIRIANTMVVDNIDSITVFK